jgi:RNA polymerase sigma factor (sigma-70 family)
VSAAKRDVLLRVHRHRLGREDLEDCFSQATLELVSRARTRTRGFASDAHIANALEQRFLSRINDRQRAVGGRSPMEAALHDALRRGDGNPDADAPTPLAQLTDPSADVDEHVAARHDLGRLRELADELSADQRLVLACQVALGMDSHEFCERFGWSVEKFRKVAQRGRARLRDLVNDYDDGERCRRLRNDLNAYVARVASDEQADRVRRHLANCHACAHTARELDLVARGVASLLPLPPAVDAETVHRFGAVGRALGRLLPFWDGGETAAAAKAGAAAAAGGGGAAGVGGSLLGAGAAKLGVAALCVAGASSGYVVCDQIGLFGGPLPRERHHNIASSSEHRSSKPPASRSSAAAQAPAPITHTVRRSSPAGASTPKGAGGSASSASSANDASSEFGFEGDSGSGGSTSSTPPSTPAARSASAGGASPGGASSAAAASSSRAPSSPSAPKTTREFGFE